MTLPVKAKETLHRYLQLAREALLGKLDGLSDYDIHRPMPSPGTNLLGPVKHTASIELGYLGDTFGRGSDIALPWFADDAEPNADMWATAQQSREDIVAVGLLPGHRTALGTRTPRPTQPMRAGSGRRAEDPSAGACSSSCRTSGITCSPNRSTSSRTCRKPSRNRSTPARL